jgi:multiple sugar transport system permease protein
MATVDPAQAPSHAAPAAEKTRRPGLRRAGGNLVRVLLVGFFAFPLLFMFMSSLKPDDQIFADLDSIKAFLPVGDISLSDYKGCSRPSRRPASWPTPASSPSSCWSASS